MEDDAPEETTATAEPANDPPRTWHLAVFTKETAELLKARAYGAPYKFGVTRASIPSHRAVGACCTDREWRELTRGYHPLYKS